MGRRKVGWKGYRTEKMRSGWMRRWRRRSGEGVRSKLKCENHVRIINKEI